MIHCLKFLDCSIYVEVVMDVQSTEVHKTRNGLIQQNIQEILLGVKYEKFAWDV